MTPTFKLPDGFTLPDGGSEDQFEALVTLRRLPDGSVAVVALDGIDLPVAEAPAESEPDFGATEPAETDTEADEPMTYTANGPSKSKSKFPDLPPDLDFADAIETQLGGAPPSQIHF